MKKFILLNSPIFEETTNEKEDYLPPLGLGYIATYLEKSKIDACKRRNIKKRSN